MEPNTANHATNETQEPTSQGNTGFLGTLIDAANVSMEQVIVSPPGVISGEGIARSVAKITGEKR